MRKIITTVVACLGVSAVFAAPAFRLQLLKGQIPAIPLSLQVNAADSIDSTIQSDLNISGRFRVLTQGNASYQLQGSVPGTVTLQHAGKTVWSQQYSSSDPAVAHQISDAVYQQLVQQPGFFTADLLFVRRLVRNGDYTQFQLVKSNLAGDDATVLVDTEQPIVNVAWSPNGQNIVYATYANGQAVVQQLSLANQQTTTLWQQPGFITDLAYSPDGNQLAMTVANNGGSAIATLDLTNNTETVLTKVPGINVSPTWGPQGQVIDFISNRSGSTQAYEYRFSDQSVKRLTFSDQAVTELQRSGQWLYAVNQQGTFTTLQKINLSTNEVTSLVSALELSEPASTADGSLLVYNAVFGSKHGLELISSDGKVRIRLLPTMGWLNSASWSPLMSEDNS